MVVETMDITVSLRESRGLGPDPQLDTEASGAFVTKATVTFPGQEVNEEGVDPGVFSSEQGSGDSPAYGLERTFTMPYIQQTYNMLCSQQVLVTVHRVPTEGEEVPEEGPPVVGTASIPLLGLLQGCLELGGWVELDGVDLGDEDPLLPPGLEVRPMPGVHLTVSVATPLFSEEETAASNFITLGGDSAMYSLPPNWIEVEGKEFPDAEIFDYKLVVHLPLPSDSNTVTLLGELQLPPPKEEAEADAEVEGAEVKEDESVPRIVWPDTQRVFLPFTAADRLKEMSEEEEPFRVEFMRVLKAPSETIDEAWRDQNVQKYKGDCWVSTASFMTPGCALVCEKTEISKTSLPADPPEASGKTKKGPPPQLDAEPDTTGDDADERLHGACYAEFGTYLKLKVELERSILPKPPEARRPSLGPSNIIQGRPRLHRFQSPQVADNEVEDILGKTVALLVEEYGQLYPGMTDANASMQADFTQALTTNGKYHTFKEVIKKTVIRLVREKFQRDGNETQEEVGEFYDNLFVYLMEKVSHTLQHAFDKQEEVVESDFGKAEKPPEVGTVEAIIRMAEEAEINCKMELAASYRQECIVMKDTNAKLWLEYALFSMRNHDLSKAEECLRESISLDSGDPVSLLAYAVLLFMLESYEEADVFFDVVLDLEPGNAVCWALRGLVYDQTNRPDDALAAYAASRRTHEDATEGEQGEASSSSTVVPQLDSAALKRLGKGAPLLQAAKFLLDIHATSLAEKALNVCQVHAGAVPEAFNALAQLYTIREDYVSTEENIAASLGLDAQNVEAWTLRAHSLVLQGKEYEALAAYRKVLGIQAAPLDNAVYLRYGQLLLNTGRDENIQLAKEIFLKACLAWPCSSSWLGVAISCYMLKENEQAESALVEANIADNQNGLVWAYTTLVCLRLERTHEADHAFGLAIRLGIDRRGVLVELGEAYVAHKKHAQAEMALRRALAMQPEVQLQQVLAECCKTLGDVDGAVDEYKSLCEQVSGDAMKAAYVKEIVKLLKDAGREKEAHKWQKKYKEMTSSS